MEGRSQLRGRPGKKWSVPVLLAGVRSREAAMEAGKTARCKVSHKSCGTVVSLAGSRKYAEESGCNKSLKTWIISSSETAKRVLQNGISCAGTQTRNEKLLNLSYGWSNEIAANRRVWRSLRMPVLTGRSLSSRLQW